MTHIIHPGDCLDLVSGLASLPDRSVDHVITDPPYSDKVHAHFDRTSQLVPGARERGSLNFGSLGEATAREVARHLARVARRWLVIFGDEFTVVQWADALRAEGVKHIRVGAWVKANPMPQVTGDRPAAGHEHILIMHQPGRTAWNGRGRPAVWVFQGQDWPPRKEHPTQKPIPLMEALVSDFTDPGETILDPFAGSGTTGVACKRLGRSFIGWERDEKYHAIAERRLAEASEQLSLIRERPAKAKQEVMF